MQENWFSSLLNLGHKAENDPIYGLVQQVITHASSIKNSEYIISKNENRTDERSIDNVRRAKANIETQSTLYENAKAACIKAINDEIQSLQNTLNNQSSLDEETIKNIQKRLRELEAFKKKLY